MPGARRNSAGDPLCVPAETPAADRMSAPLILEQFTPYRIVALGHAISMRLAEAYRNEDVTIPEWRVLAVIAQAAHVAARDVVRRTPMDKMTVSRTVARLAEKDLVKRTTDPRDKRVAALSLTPAGRAVYDRIAALAMAYEQDLLSALTPDSRAAFIDALETLERRADEFV